MSEWKPWFAWRPVTLLTMEIAWFRWVVYRPWKGWHHFSTKPRKWEYANLLEEQDRWKKGQMNE